jgi:NADH-quinone oxidoreductase subunit J
MTAALVIVGALTLIAAINVVVSKQTIYSALSLVVAVGMLSVMYLLLNAQFLFVVQLIIYAGAVMVLFVFIIALLSPGDEDRPRLDLRMLAGFAGVIAITGASVVLALNSTTYSDANGFRATQVGNTVQGNPYNSFAFTQDAVNADNAGNVQTVGHQLFTIFVLPFEVTSLILLVAVIGAVYLTRRTPRFNLRGRHVAPIAKVAASSEEKVEVS